MSGGYQLSASSAFFAWTAARNGPADDKQHRPKTVLGEMLAGLTYMTMGPMVPPSDDSARLTVLAPGNHEITPKTGALTVEGLPPGVVTPDGKIIEAQGPATIVTGETATILDDVTLRATATVTLRATGTLSKVAPSRPVLPWLHSAAVFVPKSIREPFVGDLREDMTERLAAGWSPTRVKWVAISQVAILVVRWLWSTGWFRAFRGGS